MRPAVLRVLDGGFLTTVQDAGRPGYQELGVSACGAMDAFSYFVANSLVGSPPGAAVLEATLYGPVLEALEHLSLAVTGAETQVTCDGRPVPMWEAFFLPRGARLSLGGYTAGARCYIAIKGGIDVPLVMNSRSTDLRTGFGGLEGRRIGPGDLLGPCDDPAPGAEVGNRLPRDLRPRLGPSQRVRVIVGPEADHFRQEGIDTLLGSEYTLTQKVNRMGCRLDGPTIRHSEKGPNIISNAVPDGSIQVPGGAKPILMLKDSQTTGGYPKIAVVTSPDLDRCSQVVPGNSLSFQAVSLEDAHAAYREYRGFLDDPPLERPRGMRVFMVRLRGAGDFHVTLEPSG
ncbi:MAG: biotin-dependent carboxyltransferase family protein [Bacillota bacterium]